MNSPNILQTVKVLCLITVKVGKIKFYYKNGMMLLLEYCSYSISRLEALKGSFNKGSSPGLVLSLRHLNSINSFYIKHRRTIIIVINALVNPFHGKR